MSIRKGRTAFEQLQIHYTDVDLTCSECGYEDETGDWKAVTSGSRVLYRHVCPSCGEIRKRTLSLETG